MPGVEQQRVDLDEDAAADHERDHARGHAGRHAGFNRRDGQIRRREIRAEIHPFQFALSPRFLRR